MCLKVEQMDFDIQFLKQFCSVEHDRRNFNYVSFESILIIIHEIYDNSHTPHHFLAAFHCFRVLFFSGTHCITYYIIYTWDVHNACEFFRLQPVLQTTFNLLLHIYKKVLKINLPVVLWCVWTLLPKFSRSAVWWTHNASSTLNFCLHLHVHSFLCQAGRQVNMFSIWHQVSHHAGIALEPCAAG